MDSSAPGPAPDRFLAESRPGVWINRATALHGRALTPEQVRTAVIPDMTQRIVEAVHPLRVILFGSAARGEMGPNSDLDVLVVVADGVDPKQALKSIYQSFRGLGFATDAVVVGESDLARFGDDPWMVYRNALLEGQELYHA